MLGLYWPQLRPSALLLGWAVGIGSGTWMVAQSGFTSAIYTLHLFGIAVPCYAAVAALAANLAITIGASLALASIAKRPLRDATAVGDYG